MKHIPNSITVSRILFSFILFWCFKNPYLFTALYLLCGFSDILDGLIARKYDLTSPTGARLDSIADIIFFAAAAVFFYQLAEDEIIMYLPFIKIAIIIAVIRFINLVIAGVKYHTFAILHTWGNKIAGFLIFWIPLAVVLKGHKYLWPVCIIAFLSAVEEFLIHITSTKLHIDRKSIFNTRILK